ncbi:uncharacterized protein LOC100903135 [Galendromus occidentalis]|uniref:Uncharacterized protein LOC100903135 n=1 Tax=Galendromus occidentalis TaxID=34638 RepID=A0AAJ6QT76_9ACAR|nr:uncharacterized protein LOC100903135 [Galendromus occidentalis]
MSTAEVIQCANCTFTTLTQKGLTIHLRKMHQIVSHDRKPRRTQNRRQGIRLANCSMSAKSWGLPFVCVICGYRTAEKSVIKEHVDKNHGRVEEYKYNGSQFEPTFNASVVQAVGSSSGQDRCVGPTRSPQLYPIRQEFKKIMNCQNMVVGYSSKPNMTDMMQQPSPQYQFHGELEQSYLTCPAETASINKEETCSEGPDEEDEDVTLYDE